jgi:tetratricopeptide (TPR) repeat protein
MKRSALLAVPLGFLLAVVAFAQDAPPATSKVSTAASDTTAPQAVPVTMTAKQTAEMRGDILMARKEYADAVRTYLKVLNGDTKDSLVLNKVGVAYQQLGDLNRAGRFYKQSAKADKRYASAVNNLGTVEYEKRHFGKAIALYKKALPIGTDQGTIYSNLGYAYFADKEYPQAMDSFAKALAIDPHIFDRKGGGGSIVQQRSTTDPGLFYFFVAKSYALTGDVEEAARYLKIARDDGYKDFMLAQTDPAFAKVIKDPRVQEVLRLSPSYADGKKPEDQN